MQGWAYKLVGHLISHFFYPLRPVFTCSSSILLRSSTDLETSKMSAQLRQQTLSFHSSGAPQANRPGPRPKAPTAANIPLTRGGGGRRLVGGINEQEATEAFTESRIRFVVGLPDSDTDSSDSDDKRPKKTRISYSREKKLQAITYFEMTDVLGTKGRATTPIPLARAVRTLGIDRKQLRDWRRNKTKILHIKKGAKQGRQ
jgi:hypothetical protein